MKIIDLKGEVFGRLMVVSRAPNAGVRDSNARWNCRCDCGRMVIAYGQDLRKHKVVSCGCWNAEKRTRHGLARTPEYRVFMAMKMRCENPKDAAWKNYGGRGITVDPRWSSFPQFWEDMGPRPTGGTLERIDNNKGYSPDNCTWATHKEQLNNRRNNRVLFHEGERLTLAQWAERLGLNYSTLAKRLARGQAVEDALNRPVHARLCPHCGKPIFKGETQ